jgi:hypothetical protein
MKKVFVLPYREGRWQEVCDMVNGSDIRSWDQTLQVRPGETYVLYRRMTNTPPMPNIVQGDGLTLSEGDETRHIVVIKPALGLGSNTVGNYMNYTADQVLEVWRDGACIWERGS